MPTKITQTLRNLGAGRVIAFLPGLAKIIGREESLFVQQFLHWTPYASNPDGWVYKTTIEIEDETSLTYKEQIRVRDRLKNLGILEERYERLNHRMYYRILEEELDKKLELGFSKIAESGGAPDQRSDGEIPNGLQGGHLTKGQMGKLPLVRSGHDQREDRCTSSTESTTKNTTENTTTNTSTRNVLTQISERKEQGKEAQTERDILSGTPGNQELPAQRLDRQTTLITVPVRTAELVVRVKRKTKISDEEFLMALLRNPAYQGIDIARELGKMDAWLLAHPGRQKTRKFILNWLNKIDVPMAKVNPMAMVTASADGWGTPEALVELYNKILPYMAIQTLSDARRSKAQACLQQFPDKNFWIQTFQNVRKSEFLQGYSKDAKGFVGDFDWLLSRNSQYATENFVRVHDGRYSDQETE